MLTPHGNFLVIDPDNTAHRPSIGVLITGDSGLGKSHTTLALLDRGHALVADDAPIIIRHADGRLYGTCPASIQNLLEVRGLGILHVRELFGALALISKHRLDIIIHLIAANQTQSSLAIASQQRLAGDWETREILRVETPMLTLQTQPAQMLALLIETAARHYVWQQRQV
ncbi:MAG: hypothetical protein AB7S56_08825 [Halothiobacillaceae bacterium]